ncbi:AraC family transcriptional regulator [Oceanospirillum multiglobuliferum]|uniref:AraC family transcriptional regulator n=1 Tax=Oceanospirillum multiglobuliferum TaxID=64969 RepID=UPI00190EFAB2|nr:GyrI-like domain-containing protein [Oceanospirillum multiglobuliferum]
MNTTHFSKYHFHRQFTLFMGISVAKFVQQLRLKRASYQLAFQQDKSILDIALDAQFERPESFARAFRKGFAQSPSEFRHQANWLEWSQHYHHVETDLEPTMDVQIQTFPETKLAVLEHKGPMEYVNNSAGQFIQWRKSTGLSPVTKSKTFGIIYSDPKNTAPEDFRFDIAGEVAEPVPENDFGVINKVMAGGRCAVIRHIGPHEGLDAKVYYLYGQWLPESGEELRDSPCFFHYQNFFPEVGEHELVTDIYLPIV